MSLDTLLDRALALYKDRQKIALATLLIVFTITFYIFYVPTGIIGISNEIPPWVSGGWAQGFQIVYSFNTVGFMVAFALMAFAYAFWSWAFLPSPATAYTVAVLRGVFGQHAEIRQSIGKRFSIVLDNGATVNITCRIKQQGTDDWFAYRLVSSELTSPDLENIALRHGFSVSGGKISSWISNDELHSRGMLFLTAIMLARP
jgi:hypothetical protein